MVKLGISGFIVSIVIGTFIVIIVDVLPRLRKSLFKSEVKSATPNAHTQKRRILILILILVISILIVQHGTLTLSKNNIKGICTHLKMADKIELVDHYVDAKTGEHTTCTIGIVSEEKKNELIKIFSNSNHLAIFFHPRLSFKEKIIIRTFKGNTQTCSFTLAYDRLIYPRAWRDAIYVSYHQNESLLTTLREHIF